jgi:hypothetical protein
MMADHCMGLILKFIWIALLPLSPSEGQRQAYKHFKKCGKLLKLKKTIQTLQKLLKIVKTQENHTNTSTNVEN